VCARGPSPGSYRGDRVIRGEGVPTTALSSVLLRAVDMEADVDKRFTAAANS